MCCTPAKYREMTFRPTHANATNAWGQTTRMTQQHNAAASAVVHGPRHTHDTYTMYLRASISICMCVVSFGVYVCDYDDDEGTWIVQPLRAIWAAVARRTNEYL